MSCRPFVLVLAVAAVGLAACSDSEHETGVFVDGPVAGLHYETGSFSGVTTAEGEFEYRSGETVTFTLGGVFLGSARGAARLSPFDFFEIEPPTDWLELQGHLGNRLATDFDRVFNITMFLQSLDIDRNVENGIDLGDWNERLDSETLSFEMDFFDWWRGPFNDFAADHAGVNRYRDPASVLTHLFDSLGLKVHGYLKTASVSAWNERCIYSYDASSRLVTTLCDLGNDSWFDREVTVAYDSAGYSSSILVFSDLDRDGLFESSSVENHYRDESGNITTSVVIDRVPGFAAVTTTVNSTFDSAGNLLTQVRVIDSASPEDTDYEEKAEYVTNTFASDGTLVVARLVRTDYGVDGDFDFETERIETRDAAGFVIAESVEDRANGQSEARTTTAYTNDANGLHLTVHGSHYTGGAARPDRMWDTELAYTATGRIATSSLRSDRNGDGVYDGFLNVSRTYDSFSHELVSLEEHDFTGDGVIDLINRTESSYDSSGNLVESRTSSTNGSESEPVSVRSATYTYASRSDALYPLVNSYLFAWASSER